MKILIVSYLPRGQKSTTRKLLEYTQHRLSTRYPEATYTYHELSHEQPIFYSEDFVQSHIDSVEAFHEDNTNAYGMLRTNQYQQEVLAADIIIIAHPIWNWGLPAPMKSWIDAIGWVDRLFTDGDRPEIVQSRQYANGKKILVLNSSGMQYPESHIFMQAAYGFVEHFFGILGASETATVSLIGTDDQSVSAENLESKILRSYGAIDEAILSEHYKSV